MRHYYVFGMYRITQNNLRSIFNLYCAKTIYYPNKENKCAILKFSAQKLAIFRSKVIFPTAKLLF